MIDWIRIRNLALIEEAEIEFKPGFSVITGETGAGKTVLVEAIGMLLGERAGKDSIRGGASSCEISAEIAVPRKLLSVILGILDGAGLPPPEENRIHIRRIITQSSTRNFINDGPSTLQTIREIGTILIDTHGPHEHQSLLRQQVQLELLDGYGGLGKEVAKCAEIHAELRRTVSEREKLQGTLPSPAEAEHLRHTVSEIRNASPAPGEDAELSTRHRLAANSHDILEISSSAVKMLSDSEGCLLDKTAEIHRLIQSLEKADPDAASNFLRQCGSVSELAGELSENIIRYASGIELDEQEFARIEERMGVLQSLKRKYGPALDDVFRTADEAEKKLSELENHDEILRGISEKEKRLSSDLASACAVLTAKRRKHSAELARKVCAEMRKLGFIRSDFSVQFSEAEPGPAGTDKIDFLFSANPGEKQKPLREIASSGEISRVMLALKTVLSEADSVPILIFDEIDVNIGGETAHVVGQKLRKLGSSRQVLCISHLPQVAACADTHFKVDKTVSASRTFTRISEVSGAERKSELARMLGGSPAAMKHAEELLAGK